MEEVLISCVDPEALDKVIPHWATAVLVHIVSVVSCQVLGISYRCVVISISLSVSTGPREKTLKTTVLAGHTSERLLINLIDHIQGYTFYVPDWR
jgi:hypothetical protein